MSQQAGPAGYPGQRLGLPRQGRGSIGSFGRRLSALAIDWFGSVAVVGLLARGHLTYGTASFSAAVLGVFGLEVAVLTWLAGASFGQRIVGLQVVSLNGGRVGLPRAVLRTVLLCLAAPPLIWDRDGRGLHDRAALTAVVRTAVAPTADEAGSRG